MPNRIIKESICSSEKIAALSDFEFRLWVGLITQADDAGRGDARPAIMKGHVFPFREQVTPSAIQDALAKLADACVIQLDDRLKPKTFKITGWERLQPDAGRRTQQYKQWRTAVFSRDNYTCQICGKRGGKLNAHHASRYSRDIEHRTDIENGITLCEKCHKELHHREGR